LAFSLYRCHDALRGTTQTQCHPNHRRRIAEGVIIPKEKGYVMST
jgi:hypothetical protein